MQGKCLIEQVVVPQVEKITQKQQIAAMEAGKPVALEVGSAYDLSQCYTLVDTYEKTKTPFMFLENCCFGKREMMVLNMVEQVFWERLFIMRVRMLTTCVLR